MNSPVSIIIPFYDCFDLVMARLAELSALDLPKNYEVILVDDGSVESQTKIMLDKAREMFPFFQSVAFADGENRGFAEANNVGADAADGDILCFLSSDVQIKLPFWNQLGLDNRTILGGRYLQGDTGWNSFSTKAGEKLIFSYLEGWFIACTRKAFDKIGWWDPRYSPFDYEDVDFSTTARELGYKLTEIPLYFSHMSSGTMRRKISNRIDVTNKNREKFIEKWITSGRYKNIQ